MQYKAIVVVGTRPNFVKISQLETALGNEGFKMILVHTGQHYDFNMSSAFFEELKIRTPDHFLSVGHEHPAVQIGSIINNLSEIFVQEKPDIVIVVGDVNSTLAAGICANKHGIKLAHLESGLRSSDRAMPEEINRIIVDQMSDIHLISEISGIENLKEEKLFGHSVLVGNTMIDTLVAFEKEIKKSNILEELNVKPKEYFLVTIHRPSNVDNLEGLTFVVDLITKVGFGEYKIVFPVHPRTRKRLESFGLLQQLEENKNIILTTPQSYFKFQNLIANSIAVITDSGGIQEETTFKQIPCLTLRDSTERPSTIDIGTNILLPFDIEKINASVNQILNGNWKEGAIPEKWDGKACARIATTLKDYLDNKG